MKTAELTGLLLDYWVAKALGLECDYIENGVPAARALSYVGLDCPREDDEFGDMFRPSQRADHGQPVIDRGPIAVFPSQTKDGGVMWTASVEGPGTIETFGFYFERPTDACLDGMAFGPTPLIAAMRAKVASVYGEEVPDL